MHALVECEPTEEKTTKNQVNPYEWFPREIERVAKMKNKTKGRKDYLIEAPKLPPI